MCGSLQPLSFLITASSRRGISMSSSFDVFKYPSPNIGQQEGLLILLVKEKTQPTRDG